MNIEAFFKLIRSYDYNNLEMAWLIAQGQKAAGEKFFTDFVDAVEIIFNGTNNYYLDFYGEEDALHNHTLLDLLSDLSIGSLSLYNLHFEKIPDSFSALSDFVKRLHIELTATSLPKGIEKMNQIESLDITVLDIAEIGPEIHKLDFLESMTISGSFDVKISSEITKCKHLKKIEFFSHYDNLIIFPDNFHELKSLNELSIRSQFKGLNLKKLHCPKIYLGINSQSENDNFSYLRSIIKNDQFSEHLKTLELNYESFNHDFDEFLNNSVSKADNLRELNIYDDSEVFWKLDKNFLNLKNLENIFINNFVNLLNNIEIIAQLPNLESITVFDINSNEKGDYIRDFLKKMGSEANLIIEEIPF